MTQMRLRRIGTALMAAGALAGAELGSVPGALAQTYGHAVAGQMDLQPSVTAIGAEIHSLHDLLLVIITVISVFVLALLVYVIWRFNERANPTPTRTTHHTMLEVAWTVLPVLILVIIAIPSFRLLTHQLVMPKADMTVKVTGKQWYWSYDYPKDQGDFGFDSIMKPENEIDTSKGDIRLLSVDNEAVVPVGKTIRFQVTAADVIHSFVVPAFGIRIDAVPGRLNETWFKAEREGVYYGQCSKLCGKDHAYMPIAVRVVSEQQYQAWLVDAKKKYASVPSETTFAEADAPARQ